MIFGSTSKSMKLSETSFNFIVIQITAGVGYGIAKGTKLASGFLKIKENTFLEKKHFQITITEIMEICIIKV